MKTETSRVVVLIVLLAFAAFAVQQGSATGNAARRSPVYAQELPYCPDGCAYGNVMTLKTGTGFIAFGKNDLEFQWCHAPEKDGCMRENTALYALKFRGEPVNGALYCVDHHWEFDAGLIPPCPPQLNKLSLD